MSFCSGFEKTAGASKIIGQAAGHSVRGTVTAGHAASKAVKQTAKVTTDVAKAAKKAVEHYSKKELDAFRQGYKSARGPVAHKAAKPKAPATQKPEKKSWMRRNPIKSAGIIYLATRAAMAGGSGDSQQPQYVPPQQ
jgi:hypothetical protein